MVTTGGTTTSVFVAFVVVAIGSACAERASREGYDADTLPLLTATEELRIGSVDDPDLGFSRIGGVTVDDDGNVYVLERQDREVRVFDSAGRLLRVIGRPGEGPGEFRFPSLLGFRDDTLWVNDAGLRRVTMFERDGAVLATFPAGIVLTMSHPVPGVTMGEFMAGELRRDGLLDMRWPPLVAWRGANALPDRVDVPVLRFDRAGNVFDTVAMDPYHLEHYTRVTLGGETFWLPSPAGDFPLHIRTEDGVIVVDRRRPANDAEARFTVTRTGPVGDTLYQRTFRYTQKPFSAAYLDSIANRFVGSITDAYQLDAGTVRETYLAAMRTPEFQAPITQILNGEDGSIWLRREEDSDRVDWWIVLRPDGSPRGQVELPKGSTLQWMSGDVFYAVERDDLDVPWLVRYRLQPAR